MAATKWNKQDTTILDKVGKVIGRGKFNRTIPDNANTIPSPGPGPGPDSMDTTKYNKDKPDNQNKEAPAGTGMGSREESAQAGASGEGLSGKRPKIAINLNFATDETQETQETKETAKPITAKEAERQAKADERAIAIIQRVQAGGAKGFTNISNWLAGFFRWHIPAEEIASAHEAAEDIFYVVFPMGLPAVAAVPLLIGNFLRHFVPKPRKELNTTPETAKDEQK